MGSHLTFLFRSLNVINDCIKWKWNILLSLTAVEYLGFQAFSFMWNLPVKRQLSFTGIMCCRLFYLLINSISETYFTSNFFWGHLLENAWGSPFVFIYIFYIFFFFLEVSPKRSFVGSLKAIMSPGQKGKDAILIKVGRFTIHIGFKTSPVCADRGRSTSDKNDLC